MFSEQPPLKKIKVDDTEEKKVVEENEEKKEVEEVEVEEKKLNGETEKSDEVKKPEVKPKKKKIEMLNRCKVCRQDLDDPDLVMFQGPPNGAMEEEIALFDPKLCLFNGNEEHVADEDVRPQNKLTHFSVFDESGHLCFFDNGLIEKNALLYISGFIKPVYDENPSPEGKEIFFC